MGAPPGLNAAASPPFAILGHQTLDGVLHRSRLSETVVAAALADVVSNSNASTIAPDTPAPTPPSAAAIGALVGIAVLMVVAAAAGVFQFSCHGRICSRLCKNKDDAEMAAPGSGTATDDAAAQRAVANTGGPHPDNIQSGPSVPGARRNTADPSITTAPGRSSTGAGDGTAPADPAQQAVMAFRRDANAANQRFADAIERLHFDYNHVVPWSFLRPEDPAFGAFLEIGQLLQAMTKLQLSQQHYVVASSRHFMQQMDELFAQLEQLRGNAELAVTSMASSDTEQIALMAPAPPPPCVTRAPAALMAAMHIQAVAAAVYSVR